MTVNLPSPHEGVSSPTVSDGQSCRPKCIVQCNATLVVSRCCMQNCNEMVGFEAENETVADISTDISERDRLEALLNGLGFA